MVEGSLKSDQPPLLRSGFTLIELLVVVAVIALLVSILMPALRLARRAARGVVCQSNLKQIAIGWHLYLDDQEELFYQGVNANLDYGGWEGMVKWSPRPLNSYCSLPPRVGTNNGAKLFRCPADKGDVPGYTARLPAYNIFGTSYQTNILLVGPNQIGVPNNSYKTLHLEINKRLHRLSRKAVVDAGSLLLIGDYGWVLQWMPALSVRTEWHGREAHHNVAFLDSHVEFLKIRKGLYVTPDYQVLPFRQLEALACEAQVEEP